LAFVAIGLAPPALARVDTEPAAAAGVPDAQIVVDWNDRMWELLELIFGAMGYIEVEAGNRDLEESLLRLSESWANEGLPDDMPVDTALETLDALAELEVLLLAEPARISLFVQLQSLTTIASMRETILVEVIAVPGDGGGQ
jgi:hypothetical protein